MQPVPPFKFNIIEILRGGKAVYLGQIIKETETKTVPGSYIASPTHTLFPLFAYSYYVNFQEINQFSIICNQFLIGLNSSAPVLVGLIYQFTSSCENVRRSISILAPSESTTCCANAKPPIFSHGGPATGAGTYVR